MEYVFFNCAVCFELSDFVGSLQLLLDAEGRTRTEWLPTEFSAVYDANQLLKRFVVFLDEAEPLPQLRPQRHHERH